MGYQKNLKKFIATSVIIAIIFQGSIFLHSQQKDEIVSQFDKAIEAYISGQYDSSKVRLERVIGIIKSKRLEEERKDILGKCYLLIGAISEKKGETPLAEENYRRAKYEYSVETIDGVDLNGLPIYRRVVKGEIDIDTPFRRAVEEYNNGQYDNSKNSLEQVIGNIKEGNLDKQEILGKCYLLIGAISEKKGETLLAEENYRRAKEEYGVESINGVDLNVLPIYKRIVKGIIEKEDGRRKKKFPWLWIVGGVVAAIVIFYLIQPNKNKKFYKLRVEKGDGVEGYPETGIYTYKEGALVNYDYKLLQDGADLFVTIDDNIVSSKGIIKMVKDYNLTASRTKIHIESTPSESEVYVDNQKRGNLTPCDFYIIPGMHEIRLVKDGYGKAQNTLAFENNKYYHCKVELAGYIYELGGKWGGPGNGIGEFRSPDGIAIDREGNVYVGDGGNHRIQILYSNGGYKDKWGEYGKSEGKFLNLDDIAIDKNDFIYVLDSFIPRVQKFSLNGDYKGQWGGYGNGNGEFWDPKGISVDQMDYVYVADGKNHRIQKFASNGTFIVQLGTELDTPGDIAFDTENLAYVCDSFNHRIQKFASNGNRLSQWGEDGNKKENMSNPFSIAVDDNNYVYVCDQFKRRIQKFDWDGKFICKCGEVQLSDPRGIAVSKDGYIIYAVDKDESNVQKFKMSNKTEEDYVKWEIITTSNSSPKTHSKSSDKNRNKKVKRLEK